MGKAPAFALYAGDFYMDTADWSVAEIGTYFRLLMYEWVNGAIPDDTERLARIASLDHGNFKKLWCRSVGGKFTPNGNGTLFNRRLEEEREKQRQYSESRRKGADAKWKKTDAHADAHALHGSCTDGSFQSSSSKVLPTNVGNLSPDKSECPHRKIIELYHKYLPMCPEVVEWTNTRSSHLRARWNEKAERQSLEWWEAFFKEIAKSKFLTGRTTDKDGRSFFASLSWIVNSEKFTNILEGKYHG